MNTVDRSSIWVNISHCTGGIKPSLYYRKSSTVPDSVAMAVLARNRPSPVIQVTVKQTETDPGLIGVSGFLLIMDNRSRILLPKHTFILSNMFYPVKTAGVLEKGLQEHRG